MKMMQILKDSSLGFRKLVYIENHLLFLCDKLLTDVECDDKAFMVAIESVVSCKISIMTPHCHNRK